MVVYLTLEVTSIDINDWVPQKAEQAPYPGAAPSHQARRIQKVCVGFCDPTV